MRITTWNVDKGLRPNQVAVLAQGNPDIVALQEVSASHIATMSEALEHLGLTAFVGTLDDDKHFPFGLVLASRWPVVRITPFGLNLPYMERALCALVETPAGEIEVMSVHVPPGTMKVNGRANPDAKIGTFQELTAYYRQPSLHTQILCGDFNTPKEEDASGGVTFFGTNRQSRVEQEFHHVVTREALRDAFRTVHGFSVGASSWRNKARRLTSPARRFDHVFASPKLRPVCARYGPEEDIWGARVSDHLPLTVALEHR